MCSIIVMVRSLLKLHAAIRISLEFGSTDLRSTGLAMILIPTSQQTHEQFETCNQHNFQLYCIQADGKVTVHSLQCEIVRIEIHVSSL